MSPNSKTKPTTNQHIICVSYSIDINSHNIDNIRYVTGSLNLGEKYQQFIILNNLQAFPKFEQFQWIKWKRNHQQAYTAPRIGKSITRKHIASQLIQFDYLRLQSDWLSGNINVNSAWFTQLFQNATKHLFSISAHSKYNI